MKALIPKLLGNKKLLPLVALALGLLFGAFYMFVLGGGSDKSAKKPPITVSFGSEFTTNIGDVGHYARVTITAEVYADEVTLVGGGGEAAAPAPGEYPRLENEPEVRNVVIETFGEMSLRALSGPGGLERFRVKLMRNLRTEVKLKVVNLQFTEWLVQ